MEWNQNQRLLPKSEKMNIFSLFDNGFVSIFGKGKGTNTLFGKKFILLFEISKGLNEHRAKGQSVSVAKNWHKLRFFAIFGTNCLLIQRGKI